MIFTSLEQFSVDELYAVFDAAFSDYAVPMHLTVEQYERLLLTGDVDLGLSLGAVQDGRLVGFILHGARAISGERVLYNAGTGVVPSARGAGLALSMYKYLLPILSESGHSKIVLEVLTNNDPAIKSYQRVGFRQSRFLRCYRGEIAAREAHSGVRISPISLSKFERCASYGEVKPSWQNTMASIKHILASVKLLGAYLDNQLSGCCVIDPSRDRLIQIMVHPDYRGSGIATAMLQYIRDHYGKDISITNVDSRSEALHGLMILHDLEPFIEQMEMELSLK